MENVEEFNYLLNYLKDKHKAGRLGQGMQIRLQAFLEVEKLINKKNNIVTNSIIFKE